MERIKLAAIQYELKDEPGEKHTVTGLHHSNCIEMFSLMGIYSSMRVSSEDGYITSENRFVNRKEAYSIAEEANQIIINRENRILDSYNIKICETCTHRSQPTYETVECCKKCEDFRLYNPNFM